jgi:hypothetical protein
MRTSVRIAASASSPPLDLRGGGLVAFEWCWAAGGCMRARTCDRCRSHTTKLACETCGGWPWWLKPAIIVGLVLFAVVVLAAANAVKQRPDEAGPDDSEQAPRRQPERTMEVTTSRPLPLPRATDHLPAASDTSVDPSAPVFIAPLPTMSTKSVAEPQSRQETDASYRAEPAPSSSGPTCVKGKRCGNSCIAMDKTCHK